ncbi:MAG TPA: DNA helicase RecQ [Petrimonas sp.]|uniref:DNA helicase RecQ n=2 Tax=Petrimonas sp. TaxID=2023866 RepID=UPI000968D6BF|nr:DNA helicase RecQ [Petrimonas sp.]MEA4980676.1 DNA helicase RecQ [Petrimonas sp.]MEA5062900.1 DNA helicase RecQ [Petrimonas sp.]OJV37221.1 MAG: ATP-dependent DNA helicase RecQ [Bacteroidia bacterium 43-41]HHV85934.1 DNA helicase RecQ [Petrimonas sp.]
MEKQETLYKELKKYFGFDTFKGNQKAIIESVLSGKDTFVLMPTGGGKSLCYQLPALISEGTAIIISPLIALMKNQVDAMRNFSEDDGVAHFLNSSLNKQEIEKVKQDIVSGKTKLLYVAPESLTKMENIDFLQNVPISFYAVDEAHCISEWGHDFRPEYRRIKPIINEIGPRPVIALTATATPKVQHDIQKTLGMLDAAVFKSSFNRSNLYYEVRKKTDKVDEEIIKYILSQGTKSGIVYCLSRKKVDDFSLILQANDIRALPYHAGMDAATRSANQDAFLMEQAEVIVATIAFGMGIDKPDVRYVIHYDIPKSLEGYYQETGRSGRDGGEGKCIAFYSKKDLQKLERFMQGKPVSEQEIGKQLLLETAAYAETSVCRRKMLLHYFGEDYNEPNCGNCDNCLNPKIKVEAKELLVTVLEAISVLKEKHKADYLINFLLGKETSEIETFEHNELEEFGSGSDEEESTWETVIRQALLDNYLKKDIENYGILKITKKGKEFLKKPVSFKITKEDYEDETDIEELESEEGVITSGGGNSGAADPALFSMMKDLRKKISKKLNVPPYVIFQPASLEAMATSYPVTLEELQNIPGVGAGKAKRYGQEFIELIKKHVEENEIIRPEDLRVKTVANKSKLKVSIVQAIDRKVALDDLAESKGIDFNEMLSEVEAIVYSGTKININYFLEEVMDADTVKDIYEYFREAETDNLDKAMDELSDYTETEIRLVRIKFFSEMAN